MLFKLFRASLRVKGWLCMKSEEAQRFLGCSEPLLWLGPENLKSWAEFTALKEIGSEGKRGMVR